MATSMAPRIGLVSDVTISLPADMVAASGGFSVDIGSSMAKIIYRSNKEYKCGVRIDKAEASNKGVVHYALFPRNDLGGVVQYLKDNCDFKRNAEGIVEINSSGVGGSSFKNALENDLKAKIHIVSEFDSFVGGFLGLSKLYTMEELVCPMPENAVKKGAELKAIFKGMLDRMQDFDENVRLGFDTKSESTTAESTDHGSAPADDNPHLPCLLAMCGSASGFFVIQKDGTFRMLEGPCVGGRAFYGLASYLGGTNDFKKLVEMASTADGKTVDTWTSQLFPPERKEGEEQDVYSLASSKNDMIIFPYGNLIHKKEGEVKREDLVFSTYNAIATLHYQFASILALIEKVRKVYFCGNLFDNETGQELVYIRKFMSESYLTPEQAIDVHFVRNGGNLGVLGAFMHNNSQK